MYKFLALALIGVAGLLAGVTVAGGTPPAGGPPGQGECQHGNSGKDCKPDPQPEHGKDCDEHGPKNGGVNEDHCGPVDTTPTETNPGGGHTPVVICHKGDTITVDDDAVPGHLGHGDTIGECKTETTPTTPTTPTDTTPTTPTTPTDHPGERCPPGMTPTAGKDGQPGNDECEFPKPPATTTAAPAAAPPAATAPSVTTTVTSTTVTQPAAKPKAKPKAKAVVKPKPDKPPVIVKVTKRKHGVVVIKTSDGKTHTGIMGSG